MSTAPLLPVCETGYANSEQVHALREVALRYHGAVGPHVQHYNGLTSVYPEALSEDDRRLMMQWANDVAATVAEMWDADVQLETAVLTLMTEGAQHTPHADAELEDGSPNHTPNRTHVGLLYLADEGLDFEGGRLWVESMGEHTEHPARRGLLVSFPSTREYWHGVSPVENGVRVALSVWTKRA